METKKKLLPLVMNDKGFNYLRIVTGKTFALYQKRKGDRVFNHFIIWKYANISEDMLEYLGVSTCSNLRHALYDFKIIDSGKYLNYPLVKFEITGSEV